jgi:hypothetical protein
MVKKYVLTFSISVLVLFSICIIMLMIMVPQQQASLTGSVEEYDNIINTDYSFQQTKNISEQSLVKEYKITSADILTFKKYNQLATGNSNPFTPTSEVITSNPTDTTNNTTNSNGGTSNPPATNK